MARVVEQLVIGLEVIPAGTAPSLRVVQSVLAAADSLLSALAGTALDGRTMTFRLGLPSTSGALYRLPIVSVASRQTDLFAVSTADPADPGRTLGRFVQAIRRGSSTAVRDCVPVIEHRVAALRALGGLAAVDANLHLTCGAPADVPVATDLDAPLIAAIEETLAAEEALAADPEARRVDEQYRHLIAAAADSLRRCRGDTAGQREAIAAYFAQGLAAGFDGSALVDDLGADGSIPTRAGYDDREAEALVDVLRSMPIEALARSR